MSDEMTVIDLSSYPALMTVQHVADVLQLSTHAVRARIRARDLASVKIGHSVRVPRTDLERYIAERPLRPALDPLGGARLAGLLQPVHAL